MTEEAVSKGGAGRGLSAASRQQLVQALAKTRCAHCRALVKTTERTVVDVQGEPRVFCLACHDNGPIELRIKALRGRR